MREADPARTLLNMNTTRRLCFAFLFALAATPALAAAQPNILFIMVDEMKWNAMRCGAPSKGRHL